MQRSLAALLGEDRVGYRGGAIRGVQLRQVLLQHRVAPLIAELLEVEADDAAEGPLQRTGARRRKDGADRLVAPPLADVGQDRLAEPVREDSRVGLQLVNGRDLSFLRRVAKPHRRVRVHAAQRHVLRHALDEPERRIDGDDGLDTRAGASTGPDVVLELVRHLVLQHVLHVVVRTGERDDDAMLQEVREAAGAFRHLVRRGVGLLEVRKRGVEDDRLALAELMPQHGRELRVRALRHAGDVERGAVLDLVVVEIEVLGLEHLEMELGVLDLVLAEVLRSKGRRHQCRGSHNQP